MKSRVIETRPHQLDAMLAGADVPAALNALRPQLADWWASMEEVLREEGMEY